MTLDLCFKSHIEVKLFCFCTVLILKNNVNGSDSYFFDRSWSEFEQPFGDPNTLYWIGLERMWRISSGQHCSIHFDLSDSDGHVYFAHYDSFSIGDSSSNYSIELVRYNGTDGDAMSYSSGSPFSTYDADNDMAPDNCAYALGGGFWYNDCALASLTGSPNDNFKFYYGTSWISLFEASARFYCHP